MTCPHRSNALPVRGQLEGCDRGASHVPDRRESRRLAPVAAAIASSNFAVPATTSPAATSAYQPERAPQPPDPHLRTLGRYRARHEPRPRSAPGSSPVRRWTGPAIRVPRNVPRRAAARVRRRPTRRPRARCPLRGGEPAAGGVRAAELIHVQCNSPRSAPSSAEHLTPRVGGRPRLAKARARPRDIEVSPRFPVVVQPRGSCLLQWQEG